MSTTRVGGREADVAPAPPEPGVARTAVGGWSPADPGPLGLAAFATTTFVLSVINAKLVRAGVTPVVLPLALAFGGIVQILAGMWEFRTGNTFGAVAFSSYGAFWLSVWYLFDHYLFAKAIAAGPTEAAAVGLFLWAWTIFTVYVFVASLRTSAATAVVFLLLTITFILLAIGNSGSSTNTIKLGGYFGIATAIAAWYTSCAALVNSTFGRTMLPVVPLKR